MKLGVALSGGGIKSFSQIPVLKALEQESMDISYISGTSMGSAIAALYACGISASALKSLALEIEEKMQKTHVFSIPSTKVLPFAKDRIHGGYVDGLVLEEIMDSVLSERDIEHISDVKIPIAIPSVDLKSGKTVVFVSHPQLFKGDPSWIIESDISLAKAVRASCSFPLVIAPFEYKDYILADGGISMNLPMEVLNAYNPDTTLGVTMNIGAGFEDVKSTLALGNRIYDLMVAASNNLVSKDANLIINIPVGDVWVFELGKGIDVIEEGKRVVVSNIENMRLLKRKRKLRWPFK